MVVKSNPLESLRAALVSRNREQVNYAAGALINERAVLGRTWQSIAAALIANGECGLAISAADRLVTDLGGDYSSRYAAAYVRYQCGRATDAWTILTQAAAFGGPSGRTEQLSYLNFRASLALLIGEKAEARRSAQEALSIDPRSGQAWLSLSEVADFRGPDSAAAEQLESAYRAGASAPAETVMLRQAAGRARHQLKAFDSAFEAFKAAADDQIQRIGSVPRRRDLVGISTGFTPELIGTVADRIHVPHDRAIFVTGLPRSGTTLVEQILTSHSSVNNGEELGFFRIIGEEIGGIDAASFVRWLERGNDPNDLVRLYMHLASERFGPDGRFVDKTVEAGNYMGLLLALFPNAPKFWLRRDPADNGWSAFRTMFAKGVTWSWDLRDIGHRLSQEDRIAQYWTAASGSISFVDYAGLVREPQRQIPLIAGAAGLDLQPSMLSPHETRRTVSSASVNQVRQPINLQGLGVADPYRKWLGPMIEAYTG